MTSRTDAHRPSAIKPEDYEWVAQEVAPILGLADCEFIMAERARIQAHMARTGGTYSHHEHGGNCGVCGSVNAIYTILFYHAPTNTYVRMGQDCARKCEMGLDDFALLAFRRHVRDVREHMAGKAKAAALLADAGLEAAWAIYLAASSEGYANEEFTVRDIVGKLVRYGSISEKQETFLRTLLERIATRAERQAQQAAETEAAAPAPAGRVEFSGQVLTVKVQDNDFGGSIKMLVKADAGWKLWVTVPIAAGSDIRGKRITLRATVQPSKDDPKFAFGSRPLLLKVEEPAEQAAQ